MTSRDQWKRYQYALAYFTVFFELKIDENWWKWSNYCQRVFRVKTSRQDSPRTPLGVLGKDPCNSPKPAKLGSVASSTYDYQRRGVDFSINQHLEFPKISKMHSIFHKDGLCRTMGGKAVDWPTDCRSWSCRSNQQFHC